MEILGYLIMVLFILLIVALFIGGIIYNFLKGELSFLIKDTFKHHHQQQQQK